MKVSRMQHSPLLRRFALLTGVLLTLGAYAGSHSPAFAQPQVQQDEATRAETEAKADKTSLEQTVDKPAAAEVSAEKARNAAKAGDASQPKIDDKQAQDVRPQADEAVKTQGNEHEPRIGIAKPWQLGMQEPASPVQERIFRFHHQMLILITVVSIFVMILLIYVCLKFRARNNPVPSKTTHNVLVEVVWTLVPILILFGVGYPSLKHLYYMDHTEIDGKADLTIKIIGYQWYWNYEYPDSGFAFDSYIVKDEDLKPGQPRLLTVDNELVVPVNKKVLLQLTGGDVIHSWAMPAFGVKMDAVPGHMNQTWFEATQLGTFYGQCSELCGVNHGFMPIRVRVVTQEEFEQWLAAAKAKFASVPSSRQFAALN